MAKRKSFDRELCIPSDTSVGFKLQEEILKELEDCKFPEKAVFGIRLAIEEAIINAIKHGNKLDPNKRVHVRYTIDDEHFLIEIEDEGPGFNPDHIPDPTSPENLERPSGRGLLLMRAYMTECDFLKSGNLCRMRRVKE